MSPHPLTSLEIITRVNSNSKVCLLTMFVNLPNTMNDEAYVTNLHEYKSAGIY